MSLNWSPNQTPQGKSSTKQTNSSVTMKAWYHCLILIHIGTLTYISPVELLATRSTFAGNPTKNLTSWPAWIVHISQLQTWHKSWILVKHIIMGPTEVLPGGSLGSSIISYDMQSIDELHKQSLFVHLKPEFQLGISSFAASPTDSTANTPYSDEYTSIHTQLA